MKATQVEQCKIQQSPHRTSAATVNSDGCFERVPAMEINDGRYVVRFARNAEEVDAALRLRFEIFNLELGEGLESSRITGLDEDRFDRVCHHLIVTERESGAVVGTYRLQTIEMAGAAADFYCAGEFKLEDLPSEVLRQSLEIGRACIAVEHRNTRVLFLLWRGLAAYALISGKRYLFGCCSLTSQTAADGWRAWRTIKRENAFHPNIFVHPRESFVCQREVFGDENEDVDWRLPKLFFTYLRFGAKVCSPPAIDREFKTIDFFVMFDFETIDEKTRRMLSI